MPPTVYMYIQYTRTVAAVTISVSFLISKDILLRNLLKKIG